MLKCLKPKEPPLVPETLGDHLRSRRTVLGLTQTAAARALGVSPSTVLNWERGKTEVPIQTMPTVLHFLGYDPFPPPRTFRERMAAKRRSMGWSMKQAALALGIDAGTWAAWERGSVKPRPRYEALLELFLDEKGIHPIA